MAGAPNKPLRRGKQDDDEQDEDGDRREDAADEEVRRLLEQAEGEAADHGAAVVAEPAERDGHEAVEVQEGAVRHESEEKLAAREAGKAPDRARERVARDPQVALRQAERPGREVVLRDGEERASDERAAVEQLESDDRRSAGGDREPELLVEHARADAEHARERLRLGAPLDRGDLLDHQREREGREHVEVLLEALQHRPHRHELGDDADDGASRQRQNEGGQKRHAEAQREQRPENPAEHAELARREAHHPRGGEHHVVGDADERVDRAHREPRGDDRGEHRLRPQAGGLLTTCSRARARRRRPAPSSPRT